MKRKEKLHIKDDMPGNIKRIVEMILYFDDGVVSAFARRIHVKQQYVDRAVKKLKSGNYPKNIAIVEDGIKQYLPDVDFDWYLTGKGNMIGKESKEILHLKYNASERGNQVGEYRNKNNSFIELADGRYQMITKLVSQKARAGYLTGWGDEEYIESLPEHLVTVENPAKGIYRSFEITGDSMDYDGRDSIPDKSIVTGRQISRSLWNSKFHINDYKDFIIICYDGILCKRIIDHDVQNGKITIHSLNPDKETYPDQVIELKDVMQIFNIVKKEINV